ALEARSYNLYEPMLTSALLRKMLSSPRPKDAPLLRFLGVSAVVDGSPTKGYRLIKLSGTRPLTARAPAARALPDAQAAEYLLSQRFAPEKEVVLPAGSPINA